MEMISSPVQSTAIVSVSIAAGRRTAKPTTYWTMPPTTGSVFSPCHFSKSVASVMPPRAARARATAIQGLAPSERPERITMSTPAKPRTRPNHSIRPPRPPPVRNGVRAATRIGCSAMMIAVVPAFMPRFIAR